MISNYFGRITEKISCYSSFSLTALKMKDAEVSYRQLETDTTAMAAFLSGKLHNKRQEPVVIYMQRSIRFVEYMLATLKCGCFYIPIENIPGILCYRISKMRSENLWILAQRINLIFL